jgi:hypothetical protein
MVRSGPPLALFTGQWDEAERLLTGHVTSLRQAGNMNTLGHQLWWLGYAHAARDEPERALQCFDETLQVVAGRSLTFEVLARARLTMLLLELGRESDARAQFARCEDVVAQGNGWRARHGDVALARGVLAAAAGDHSVAEHAFTAAVGAFREFSFPWDEAEALHVWGRVLLGAGHRASAVEKLDAALDIYRGHAAGDAWSDRVLRDRRRAG